MSVILITDFLLLKMLTDKQIEKYQLLYKKHFGKEISKEEAYNQGIKLIRLLNIIYKPITKKEYEKYNSK